MFLAIGAVVAAIQLSKVDVTIDVDAHRADVSIELAFSAGVDRLILDAIRWPGQTLSLGDTEPEHLPVTDRGGSWHLELPADAADTIRIAYRVTGVLDRIPLFVPNVPTAPNSSAINISVSVHPPNVAVADAFPRFTQEPDGSFTARPANVPSFVFIPSDEGMSRARVADATVLLLLLLATVVWFVRGRGRAT